jgi:cytochrome c biogenesis protein CcdA
MTGTLFLTLIGIAIVDSLNPSLFVAQFYLLTTPKPIGRILSYIAGVMVVMIVGGLLILSGIRTVIAEFFANADSTLLYSLQFAIGLAILLFGLWMRVHTDKEVEAQKPRSLKLIHTFVLGMAVMINEITTALPYFVALEQMAQAELNFGQTLLALLIYNFFFSLPLFGFLVAFLMMQQRFTFAIERINRWIQKWTPRIIKYTSIAFGAVLVLNAGAFLVTGTAVFS